jgi:hypothetical protein
LVIAIALNSLFGAGTTRFYCYGSVNDGDKENFAVDINFGGRVIGLPSSEMLIQFISLNGPCTPHPSLHEGASGAAEVSGILARERVFALVLIRQ